MRYRNLRTVVLSGLVMILFPSNAISVTTTVGEPCSTAHFSPVLLRRLSIRGGGLPAKKDSTTDYWNDWSLGPRTEKKKQESSSTTNRRRKGGRSSAAPLAPPLSVPDTVPGAPTKGPDEDVPDELVVAGSFLLSFEEDTMVFQTQMPNRVPFFNAALYSAPPDIRKLGTVEDVYGPIHSIFFTLKCDVGVLPASFPAGFQAYIAPTSTMPLSQVWANTKQASCGKAKQKKQRIGRRDEEGGPRRTIRHVRAFS